MLKCLIFPAREPSMRLSNATKRLFSPKETFLSIRVCGLIGIFSSRFVAFLKKHVCSKYFFYFSMRSRVTISLSAAASPKSGAGGLASQRPVFSALRVRVVVFAVLDCLKFTLCCGYSLKEGVFCACICIDSYF